ncbi:ABC transporter substrate-binding protein [Devosia honganensis]|uniref:ABC transporter substrate-binding protein n=1 Tax=Devosia honganensis TaxID=1610527 RepID=A0ABV7WYA5_9HYPH
MIRILSVLTAALIGLTSITGAQAQSSNTLTVAVPFEPQTLDSMSSTTDLVALITGSVLEPLYAFDAEWKPAPVLAARLPEISADGTEVTIPLRTGLKFHDGSNMDAADVVASLQRWIKLSPRGQIAGKVVTDIAAVDDASVKITLSQPFAPLLPLLSFNTGAAVVFPEEVIAGNPDTPITETTKIVGTGVFQLAEHVPDQFVRLVKYEDYTSPEGEPSGFAGSRSAGVDEIRFFPVPDGNTRLSALMSGQYDIVLGLSPEAHPQVSRNADLATNIIRPSGWLLFVENTKKGPTSNEKFRQAVQAALNHDDIMLAAYGIPDFYTVSPSLYAEGTSFYSEAGAERYNQKNIETAKALLAESGYNGEPFRLLTSQQYDFVFKAAVVASENLRAAGINVELVNLDWASMLQQRNDDTSWEAFISFFGFVPEPSLLATFNPTWYGWWDDAAKTAAMDAFTSTVDPAERLQKWDALQTELLQQAPWVQLGSFAEMVATSASVQGLRPVPFLPLWNVTK